MKAKFKALRGSVVAPKGFLASGVFCDIKRLGTGKGSEKGKKRDLALIVSEVPATAAGMFTTNQVRAAPVKVCVERVKKGTAQAIVINSGNANACTGRQGLKDALQMTALTAEALAAVVKRPQASSNATQGPRHSREFPNRIPADHVLVASTGRIGLTLPMDNVKAGIREAVSLLDDALECADHAVEAIMTSDTRAKQIAVEFNLNGRTVRIGGICKGAGMIQPGMSPTGGRPAAVPGRAHSPSAPTGGRGRHHATMLCFLTTDAAIEAKTLRAALQEAVANSFNRITVDGDMSTNDTVLVLANGRAGNSQLQTPNSELRSFKSALSHVCLELAKMIVRDGEGVSRFVTVRLNGARDFADADAAARAVANSALVKTSWNGGDPNWGRIIDALGYSPAKVVEEKVDIGYSAPGGRKILWSVKRGQPTGTPFKALCDLAAKKEFELHVDLNLGRGGAVIYTADLTAEYVEFNKGAIADPNDPSTLGG